MKSQELLPDFSGKCLSITIQDDSISHDLLNPRFEYQGGRLFIIGITPENATASNWVAGCESAIAWSRVTDYFVFENEEKYQAAIRKSEDYHKDDPKESGK